MEKGRSACWYGLKRSDMVPSIALLHRCLAVNGDLHRHCVGISSAMVLSDMCRPCRLLTLDVISPKFTRGRRSRAPRLSETCNPYQPL
jgi:hypothetical protein